MAAEEEQPRKRTPFSARLPQVPAERAVPIVEALAALGAPATPQVIAQQMGTSPSSSGFKTRLAAAGYYGLIEVDGSRRTLTPRGEALAGGDEDRTRQARREAVMGTNFGPVIHSLRGRQISEATIALRLQSDLQVPQASARNVAKALIESARYAELLSDDDRLDAAAIEQAAGVMPQPDESTTRPRQRTVAAPQAPRPTRAPERKTPVPEKKEEVLPLAGGVQVVVKIDAANLTPQEIAELVRALQTPRA